VIRPATPRKDRGLRESERRQSYFVSERDKNYIFLATTMMPTIKHVLTLLTLLMLTGPLAIGQPWHVKLEQTVPLVLCPGDLGRGAKLFFFQRTDKAEPELSQRRDAVIRRLRDLGATVFVRDHKVVEVNGNRSRVTDNDLEGIGAFSAMTDLSLEETRVTAAGMRHLRGLKRLEWLNLYRCKIGDDGLAAMGELPNLQHLPVGKSGVTDAGLESVSKFRKLEYLGLRGNSISDAGLRHVRPLTHLKGLNLAETKVTDQGIRQLADLPKLARLWLSSTKVTDDVVPHLARLKTLRQLYLEETGLTKGGIQQLRRSLPQCRIETGDGG
jgi:hypothetical protein